MSVENIISSWEKKNFKSLYWLEGDEGFYIDKIMNYAERHILSESEAEFNLTIFYGRDANWSEVTNACKRFPMFAERQVVLLKEAQYMKDIAKMEPYFENPQPSTTLIIGYKEKKLDARTKLAKTEKKKGELFASTKIFDSKLPEWTNQIVKQRGFSINPKAVLLLVDHIGNDLSRIDNEVNKILINLNGRKDITEEDIENYVGISKEFNVFELQMAVAQKDLPKAIRIIQYFESNPKSAPIQLILPALYNFFSKVIIASSISGGETNIASAIGVSPYFVKDYLMAARNYNIQALEMILLQLHQYNLRSIGIDTVSSTSQGSLLKEMVVKIIR
jgi:DNA polymerase-3 subunit delta